MTDWTQIIGAVLSIAAALITYYLNKKKVWPFKEKSKIINDEQNKFENKIDASLAKKNYADYLDASDSVLDKRERLRRENENDNKADK